MGIEPERQILPLPRARPIDAGPPWRRKRDVFTHVVVSILFFYLLAQQAMICHLWYQIDAARARLNRMPAALQPIPTPEVSRDTQP